MGAWSPLGILVYIRRLLLCGCALLASCVSVQVEPLTHESYPARTSGEPVQWLETEPRAAHLALARIIATSRTAGEEGLRTKILTRARALGADAVVAGKFDILESMGPGPRYESTLGPASASFSPYSGGWGWWSPFYYDSWSFMQSSVDQPEWEEYLSGTAIRYLDRQPSPTAKR